MTMYSGGGWRLPTIEELGENEHTVARLVAAAFAEDKKTRLILLALQAGQWMRYLIRRGFLYYTKSCSVNFLPDI